MVTSLRTERVESDYFGITGETVRFDDLVIPRRLGFLVRGDRVITTCVTQPLRGTTACTDLWEVLQVPAGNYEVTWVLEDGTVVDGPIVGLGSGEQVTLPRYQPTE